MCCTNNIVQFDPALTSKGSCSLAKKWSADIQEINKEI